MRTDGKRRAEILKALADETRLRIFAVLMERGDTCVCELTQLIPTTGSNLSFHLNKLKAAGLILDRKVGKWMFYRPNPKVVAELQAWLCPLFDATRIPAGPAPGSMYELCCRDGALVSLTQVRLRKKKGGLVAEVV